MSAEAIRGYLRALRIGLKQSQKTVADQVGISPSTYGEWEVATQQDLRASTFLHLMIILHGDWMALPQLADPNATEAVGDQLAAQTLRGVRIEPDRYIQEIARQQSASVLLRAASLMDQGASLPDAVAQAASEVGGIK